jgi:Fe2+ or Zn2+ uptake regulation protein
MALKNTRQRAAILKILRSRQEPVSAEEIYAELCREGEAPALSTVYRNLERFVRDGLAVTELLGDSVTRYTVPREQHGHYLICTGCSAKIHIEDCPLSELEEKLSQETGFSIESHTLTLYGKCPRCMERDKHKE